MSMTVSGFTHFQELGRRQLSIAFINLFGKFSSIVFLHFNFSAFFLYQRILNRFLYRNVSQYVMIVSSLLKECLTFFEDALDQQSAKFYVQNQSHFEILASFLLRTVYKLLKVLDHFKTIYRIQLIYFTCLEICLNRTPYSVNMMYEWILASFPLKFTLISFPSYFEIITVCYTRIIIWLKPEKLQQQFPNIQKPTQPLY